ncbi:MAG TPA: AAA family ATPase [Candidatus Nanoarchaeia archaeon]|nr:AAA family ATPase [Candidatus Nanoarchaeia archaeon]
MAKTIGIISIKGGVGKTTSTINIGAALAELGRKVLLVDADFTSPNLALHFGIVAPQKTLHHVFQGKISAQEAIQSYHENLDILPCSVITEKVHPGLLKEKIQSVRKFYDFILIDAAPTLNDVMLSTILASDQLLVITSPDYPTLNATLHAVRVAQQQKTPIVGLVVNKVRGKRFELSRSEIEDAAGVPVIGSVSDDVNVPASVAETRPAVHFKPRAQSSAMYRKVAQQLAGVEEQPGLIDTVKSWLRIR